MSVASEEGAVAPASDCLDLRWRAINASLSIWNKSSQCDATVMTDQNLLDILQAHGQQFLDSFSLSSTKFESKKRKRTDDASVSSTASLSEEISYDTKEWGGITEELGHGNDNPASEHISDFGREDDEFTAASSYTDSKVVVFQDIVRSTEESDSTSRSRMKAFMQHPKSSKVSKLRQDDSGTVRKEKTEEEIEDERTNAQNDAILHRLIHTKLLSGSLNPDFDMTPAQRRKALAGRVLEVSGAAKFGKGEKSVRDMERNKAYKRVRDGLKDKQKQREKQRLDEVETTTKCIHDHN
ncbi:hypothetical protein C0995_000915 [Termitomyces sp. Mi166|nr:hypothetical protein C0995_000915 [Termitomyces sp. Mi166\